MAVEISWVTFGIVGISAVSSLSCHIAFFLLAFILVGVAEIEGCVSAVSICSTRFVSTSVVCGVALLVGITMSVVGALHSLADVV